MATEKLKRTINEIDDPAVASALRAVNSVLVDSAVQTIARYIRALEQARDKGRAELLAVSKKLSDAQERHARWAEEAMEQRDRREGGEQ